jgi:major membrane immunogen (membrane-anchored lipoprotein)
MRLLCAAVLAACLVGCNVEANSSSESTTPNPDGSTTTTKTKTWTKNGVSGGEKTETTIGGKDGKISVVSYEKKDGEWVKK